MSVQCIAFVFVYQITILLIERIYIYFLYFPCLFQFFLDHILSDYVLLSADNFFII